MARTKNVATAEVDNSKKVALSTQVSFNFGTEVKTAAAREGTTISEYISNLVYASLGLEMPEEDKDEANSTPDRIQLSAIIDPTVKTAFEVYAKDNEETVSSALKKLLADATGYDLALEPKVDRSAAIRAARERKEAKQNQTVDILMSILASIAPEKAAEAAAAIKALG